VGTWLGGIPVLRTRIPSVRMPVRRRCKKGCQHRSVMSDHSATSLTTPAQKKGVFFFRKCSCEGETAGSSHMLYHIMFRHTEKKVTSVSKENSK